MHAWLKEMLLWAELSSPAFFFISIVAPIDFLARRRRWALRGLWLIFAQCGADALSFPLLGGFLALAIVVLSLLVMGRGFRNARRLRTAWIRRFNTEIPLRLQPPFEGQWKGLSTGPSAGRNHHLAARDQWYAVDWVRVGGDSRRSRILSPVDGVVAYVEDGHVDRPARLWIQRDLAHPAGNYVSIRVAGRADCYVILAHLECRSVAVQAGQTIRAGDLVGMCGNSGNTSIPHLHIHAQRGERFSPGSSWGIPVMFGTELAWLKPREMIGGTT